MDGRISMDTIIGTHHFKFKSMYILNQPRYKTVILREKFDALLAHADDEDEKEEEAIRGVRPPLVNLYAGKEWKILDTERRRVILEFFLSVLCLCCRNFIVLELIPDDANPEGETREN